MALSVNCIMSNSPPTIISPQAKYLGHPSRKDYPVFHRWLVGHVWNHAHFETEEERDKFASKDRGIKDHIASTNYRLQDGDMTKEEHTRELKDVWCPLVYSFIQTYGKTMVSDDIRWALNDVEKNVGLPETTWTGHELTTEDARGLGEVFAMEWALHGI